MGMISEFKEFIAKGNVLDLAVGVVIGAAFGKIVSGLVDGIIMPIISMLTGGVDVSGWKHVINPAQIGADGKEIAAEVAIKYGDFIQSIINFLIVAFVIFLVVKAYNRMRKPAAEAPAATPEDVLLLREIRDSLKK
ncbi:large conductance mechanosensitive channel protein MscL [Thermomonas aquatica]|jgi:large conductance mechanosensitive channel|uniref:Large-conductance mechanosensitive channel n=1 Tax=Thermomonas aquatica TaxID=2202149 RepID=A0A5B7ZTK9_9GAMM|nr:large conductance mechanosensitive channel protein MscL [Thermomonas aquatica]QDA57846.1 large conductance mechanosensitive channel protein MscL [Thermomonas aquatica]